MSLLFEAACKNYLFHSSKLLIQKNIRNINFGSKPVAKANFCPSISFLYALRVSCLLLQAKTLTFKFKIS